MGSVIRFYLRARMQLGGEESPLFPRRPAVLLFMAYATTLPSLLKDYLKASDLASDALSH